MRFAVTTEKTDPTPAPTPEDMDEYRRLLQVVRTADASGARDEKAEKELQSFIEKTGIANEPCFDPDAPDEYDYPDLTADEKP
jgi:hypothetical protein